MAGPEANGHAVKILSRSQPLSPAPAKTEAPAKLKSILVVPDLHYEDEVGRARDQLRQEDLSPEWKVVKSKKGMRAYGLSFFVECFTPAATAFPSAVLSPAAHIGV
jgi:hypothetical protein